MHFTSHSWHAHEPTCVTFSVTLWVLSMSLQGAMMSISPEGRAMSGSGLKSTKLRVICGILEMVRYRMRSESDVEFKMLDLLFTAPAKTHIQVWIIDNNIKSYLSFFLPPSSPVLLLPSRILALRFFRSQSGLMASISSTEEARRMLWKLSRERLCDREQLEPEPSGLRLRRWWGATQGDDCVRGPARWVLCGGGGGGTGGSELSKVRWSSWRSSGQLCRADLGNKNGCDGYK